MHFNFEFKKMDCLNSKNIFVWAVDNFIHKKYEFKFSNMNSYLRIASLIS